MSGQHTPGPLAMRRRPRRWGIPTPAQWRLLVDCLAAGGSDYQRGHSLATLNACETRDWITVLKASSKDDGHLAKLTGVGFACIAGNAEDEDAARAAIAKATGSAT